MILFQYIRKYYLIFRFKELIRGIVCIIIILYRGNKMATEFLIACILFTIQIKEILRAKILKQILLRLCCRERVGIKNSLFTLVHGQNLFLMTRLGQISTHRPQCKQWCCSMTTGFFVMSMHF